MKITKIAAIIALAAASFALSSCCSSSTASRPAPASMGYSKY